MSAFSVLLDDILSQLYLTVAAGFSEKIFTYLGLLDRWNRAYNLTAITDPRERLIKHIADSLAAAPYLKGGERWLDVGSGAGLPGIPLALLFPNKQWTLLDSNAKKTRFLVQVKAVLQLSNVEVVQNNVESFKPVTLFDGIISRAWTQLDQMIAKTQHLYKSGACLWAMKGTYPSEELALISQPYTVFPLRVPCLAEQRHLVCVSILKSNSDESK